MGDHNYSMTFNSTETDDDIDWASFLASESHDQQIGNCSDPNIGSSSTVSKGKHVMESSDSKTTEFSQSPSHAGKPMEGFVGQNSSTLINFNAIPYKPQYNSVVGHPISQTQSNMPNTFQQNNGIPYNQSTGSDLVANIYNNWSSVVENAGTTQTSMVNPLQQIISLQSGPAALASPVDNLAIQQQQQQVFNNQLLQPNDYNRNLNVQNQSYSDYFLSNLSNHRQRVNPAGPNDSPRMYNYQPSPNTNLVAPRDNQLVVEQKGDSTWSQHTRPPLGEKQKSVIPNEWQEYRNPLTQGASNFQQQGQGSMPILESSQSMMQMNAGHSSNPHIADRRRPILVDQPNKDSSMFHAINVQTNEPPTDTHNSSQQITMLKPLEPSRFQEKNQQSFLQKTSKDAPKSKEDSYFPKRVRARSKQEGTMGSHVNQTSGDLYNTFVPMQANQTQQLEIEDSLDSIQFDPREDTYLTADEDINDPWIDQSYAQVQAMKKKYARSLKISLNMYLQRERVLSGLGKKEKSEQRALRKMINFLCMPIREMKNLTMRNFSFTKCQIMITYNKIITKYPNLISQNLQVHSFPSLSRDPLQNVSALTAVSTGKEGTLSLQENAATKSSAPKKRKKGSLSNNKSNNQSSDNMQLVPGMNESQIRVQNPGQSSLIRVHETQPANNLTQQHQIVQNQTQQTYSYSNQFNPQVVPNQSFRSNLNGENNQKSSSPGDSQVLKGSPVPNNTIEMASSQRATEAAQSEVGLAINSDKNPVPLNEPDLLSKELRNKMKNLINAVKTTESLPSSSPSTVTELLNDIKSINKISANLKLELGSGEECDEANDGNGIVLVCNYNASPSLKNAKMVVPSHVFPVLKLRMIVPSAYPNVSPVLLEPLTNQRSPIYDSLTNKTHSLFLKCCRGLSNPFSLDGIVRAWQASARTVIMDYAHSLGQGTLTSYDSRWGTL